MSSMGWGSRDAPEPADVTESVKLQANAGTSCESMLPAKRSRPREMKPNRKEKLEAPDFSRGEDVTAILYLNSKLYP